MISCSFILTILVVNPLISIDWGFVTTKRFCFFCSDNLSVIKTLATEEYKKKDKIKMLNEYPYRQRVLRSICININEIE